MEPPLLARAGPIPVAEGNAIGRLVSKSISRIGENFKITGVGGERSGPDEPIQLRVVGAAVERYGEWSPECYYGAWLDEVLAPGARFEARNRFPDGLETYVTCVVTAAS